jgi:hypothetical protein
LQHIVSPSTGLHNDCSTAITTAADHAASLRHGVDCVSASLLARTEEVLVEVHKDDDPTTAHMTKNGLGAHHDSSTRRWCWTRSRNFHHRLTELKGYVAGQSGDTTPD